jgi:NADH-quinone oxidoreductase subunit L
MEGPTPVSALIHAATMVTAGVYLIARLHPLFERAPAAADVGTVVGCVTLLMAGTIALVVTDLKRVIAYSTMSQIGYMIMAVSSGAYVAGLFHLMTHAFFKALLFMAAGSLIAAMAGLQSLDRMGGFRRALPFTFVGFVVGGLALAGAPPFSGYFSKDQILLDVANRGGWHWALYVLGYLGALLTAVYTFRMIFRAFWGEPVPEARELEQGHLHHVETPTNPLTGEVEDTDVGFPGPEHHIAERAGTMRAAMTALIALAAVGGVAQLPKVNWLEHFLDPSFRDSPLFHPPTQGPLAVSLVIGAVISVVGIALAYQVWVRRPGTSGELQERLAPVHRLLVNKWYFDELIDFAFVRPVAWFGRFAQQTFERVFVDGTLVGGTTGLVRAGSAAVRAAQTGFVRYYAGLLILGVTAVGLYFLLQA